MTEPEMTARAFALVDELNTLAEKLRADYTLEVKNVDVSVFGDAGPRNRFQLRITKDVLPPGARERMAAKVATLGGTK